MKKLCFIAALALTAALAQAAQLDWSLASKAVTMQNGSNAAGVPAYLLAFGSAAAADTFYASLKSGATTLAAATGGAVDHTTTATGKSWGSISRTADDDALVEGAQGYYAILFTQTVDGKDYFLMSGTTTGIAYDPAGKIETEGTPANFNSGMFGAAGSRTGWTAVAPEPTSMALLLFGAAAFGLRRKRA